MKMARREEGEDWEAFTVAERDVFVDVDKDTFFTLAERAYLLGNMLEELTADDAYW